MMMKRWKEAVKIILFFIQAPLEEIQEEKKMGSV